MLPESTQSESPVRTSHAINAHQYNSPSKLHPLAEETQRLAFATAPMQPIPVTKESCLLKPAPNAHLNYCLSAPKRIIPTPSILESHVHTIASPTRNLHIYKHLQTKVAAKSRKVARGRAQTLDCCRWVPCQALG